MAVESIYALRKPGFPKESFDESTYTVEIEYIGLDAILRAASPAIGTAWGDHAGLVQSARIDPEGGTDYSTLYITCGYAFDTSDGTPGTKLANETSFEIDWVDVQRSLIDHPVFAPGGANELTDKDRTSIESWRNNPDAGYKADYIYKESGDYSEAVTALDEELSANAKLLAKGILLGIEYWVDKAPVARRTDTYVNGPPPKGTAGLKEVPAGFPALPDGYEWIRDADRALRAGGQNKWTNETSWIGAKKVLIDAAQIFWTL